MGKTQNPDRPVAPSGIHISAASCIQRSKAGRTFLDNLDFIMASLTYIAANAIDYLFTVPGVKSDPLREGNPLIRGYIDLFGAEYGVLVCKLLLCIGVISAMRVIDLAHREKRTWLRAEYILYGGAILMTLSGLLWLF